MKNLSSFIQKIRTSAFMESFKFSEDDELEEQEIEKLNEVLMNCGIVAPDEIAEPAKNN